MRPPWTSRLPLAIDVGERLPVGVADDVAGVCVFDRPGRREAACLQRSQPANLRHHGRGDRAASAVTGQLDLKALRGCGVACRRDGGLENSWVVKDEL